ncbi:MAG: hypothetical protein HC907_14965 [Richelia sp. SM1_7_0]|nr:hypothetical protein [Richelia sp. SM1_7_0]
MNTPRIPLKGETLAACNRILSQTPIESYTQIFSILLMRYEQDLIEATNGYLRPTSVPSKVPSQPDKVPNEAPAQPDKVPNKASMVTNRYKRDQRKPQENY